MPVLTLALAKTHLNITVVTHDAELQTFIDAAEAVIEQHCGPLASTAKTSRVRGGTTALVLPSTPAISLTTVTPAGGTALTLGDLNLDLSSGVVTYNSDAEFGDRYYDVAYQAGRATCPADLLMAVKELLRHLWRTQRGPASTSPEAPTAGAGYLLPHRVTTLIAPHLQHGFA